MKLQEAVKKETLFISSGCVICTAFVLLLFYILHRLIPAIVPFGPKVISGGILGCMVAVLNFFFMALTVQKVASISDEGKARGVMAVSYRNRMLFQILWVVLAFALPIFNGAAGLIPLFIPSLLIKARAVVPSMKGR